MRFDLSETQALLKNSVREFLRRECPMAEVRRISDTADAFDGTLWSKIAAQGWAGLLFPEEYDGGGMGMVELAAAMEEMGRALMPGPYLATSILAGVAIESSASEDRRRRYLAPLCRGELRGTLALLESSASWDPSAVAMPATRGSGGLRLDGRKLFVQDAAIAGLIVCAARSEGEPTLCAVDARSPGLTISPMQAMDLTRRLYAVEFDGVDVPEPDVLARGERARAAIERTLDTGAVAVSAEMLGGMHRLVDLSVDYAKTRKQFGRPIGQFQAVQHMCADMLLMVEGVRSAVYYAAYAMQEGLPEAPLAVSIAKAYASDGFRETGNRAIQIHGGMGFTWENDLHLYYRRAKASEILFGDATYHRERIARLAIDP
jgi:alkylation response protein AidB-like acyl-CoA dehydrogenase